MPQNHILAIKAPISGCSGSKNQYYGSLGYLAAIVLDYASQNPMPVVSASVELHQVQSYSSGQTKTNNQTEASNR